jgi:flagellar motor switch protein FliG
MRGQEYTGLQKCAVLLIALGTERSAAVLKELDEREIEQLTVEVVSTDQVTDQQRRQVIAECYHMGMVHHYLRTGGYTYAEEMLKEALGDAKANELIERLQVSLRAQHFGFLRNTDAFQIASVLQEEQPQTMALVLSHLPPARSAEVLTKLPIEMQSEVARRIATMEPTIPEVVEGVEAVLHKRFSGIASTDSRGVGGIDYLVKLLGRTDRTTERAVLDYMDAHSPELAEELRNKMFMFEDLANLDDQSLQRLLREVDGKDLATALRGAQENLRDAIFRNLSSRASDTLREDIETGRPMRPAQIGEAQQRIVAVARRLDEAGEIMIQRGGENALV